MISGLWQCRSKAGCSAGETPLLGRWRPAWAPPAAAAAARLRRAYATAADAAGSIEGSELQQHKQLTILHFNDVYNIDSRPADPVGGAARFMAAARRYAGEQPLVLFSGDCLNPSLMSAFTRGEQMVQVLNCIGVHAACAGNHDFDFGIPTLQQHMQSFRFPWLLSNVLDARTGEPLGGCERSRIITWQGVRVGLMGLVEREWLLTIPSVEDDDITFLDFCEEGRRLAAQLAAQGADLVVALTHMRTPNDLVLAANVPEIQLILGGHDHHYEISRSAPHGTLVFKSGTDFREFSIIRCGVPPSLADRPAIDYHRVEINSAVPEDPEMGAIVRHYLDLIGTKMDEPLGWTHTDLDARFDTVRREESNIGSMFADIMRISLGADIAFFNGGTIRSDEVHEAGQLVTRDFVAMLPFTDELVLLELSGHDVLVALETGVGSWPALEGRFLQVSGLTFAFDADQPRGSRVVPGSVLVGGRPLDLGQRYKVATKAYLRGGKDGFESLKAARVLVDGETNPRLATLVQYLWMRVEQLNERVDEEWAHMLQREAAAAARDGGSGALQQAQGGNGGGRPPAPAPPACINSLEEVSVSSIDHWDHAEAAAEQEAGGSGGSGNGRAVYAPGAPSSGTATGGPGSIPLAEEQHMLEVTTTGAAISLALLLQHRGEQEEAVQQQQQPQQPWAALSFDSQEARRRARHSTAALSALAWLSPCTHGLDELIVFDAVQRRFGIAPRVEGRIVRLHSDGGGQ